MKAGQQRQGRHGTHKSHKHVPLRVPNISLSSKKFIRRLSQSERRPPLDEFIEDADDHADAEDKKKQHLASRERRLAKQDLAREDCGYETLGEVSQAVVMISCEMKEILHPETQRG